MNRAKRREWAYAFIEQSVMDSEFAHSINRIKSNQGNAKLLGSKPELYCPAIYAYCQQAIEKALKAYHYYEKGPVRKTHNPLDDVMKLSIVDDRSCPDFLKRIKTYSKSIHSILDKAPGSESEINTEYPFERDGRVVLPHEVISEVDVINALETVKIVVTPIHKFLEGQKYAP